MPPPSQKTKRRTPPPPTTPTPPEVVDPVWIIKGLVGTILAAIVCGYLTLCLLFFQGQWQLVLHPKRTTTTQSPVAGTLSELIHFAPDDSATPQLTGWWIPATPASRYGTTTLLYLPAGDGALADSAATLTALHNLGINLFAFDYRGYGQSAPIHPSQSRMTADADAALQYLTTSRHLPTQQIVLYGVGVGTSLATNLAAAHASIAALILESPKNDLLQSILTDPRTQLVPAHLLFRETFPLEAPLAALHTPKLLLSNQPLPSPFKTAADPKMSVAFAALPSLYTQPAYTQALTRFLDQYLPPAPLAPPTL